MMWHIIMDLIMSNSLIDWAANIVLFQSDFFLLARKLLYENSMIGMINLFIPLRYKLGLTKVKEG